MNDEYGKQVLATFSKLLSERAPLDTIWGECYQYTYPIRGEAFFTRSSDGLMNASAAKSTKAKLFDSTSTDSIRLLASSVVSALTPPHSQWFSLAIPNIDDEDVPHDGREWLEDAAKKLWTLIHSSNYDSASLEFFIDNMIAGMSGLFIEKRNGKLFFELWPLHTMYCQDTLKEGRIDTVYRLVNLHAAEAIRRFGLNMVSDKVKQEFEQNPYSNKTFPFIHAIRPRLKNGKQTQGKLKTQLPWESVYVCKDSGKIVSNSGYHEMPAIVPRWTPIPDTDYAVGPMYDALPDAKTLNKVVEIMMMNAELAISGTFIAKDDGVFNPATMQIGPRKVVMVADTNNLKPLASGGDISFAVNEIGRLQGQIRRTLLADQLGPTEKANMSATEVQTRTAMIRTILGPIFSRMQSEFLQHLIDRCFGLAFRDGDLGQPPESLRGRDFKVDYRSPLARAQKLEELQAMDKFEGFLAQVAQVKPEIIDLYDIEAAARKRADHLGVDISLIREKSEVQKIQKQRAEQMAQQQEAQMAMAAQGQAPGEPQ